MTDLRTIVFVGKSFNSLTQVNKDKKIFFFLSFFSFNSADEYIARSHLVMPSESCGI
jgi:hypothetical protein